MFNTNQFQMFVSVRLNRRIIFVHLVNQILYVDGITMSKTWNVTNFCMTPNVVAAVEMFFSQNTDVKWHVWLSAIKLRGKYIKKEMAQKNWNYAYGKTNIFHLWIKTIPKNAFVYLNVASILCKLSISHMFCLLLNQFSSSSWIVLTIVSYRFYWLHSYNVL